MNVWPLRNEDDYRRALAQLEHLSGDKSSDSDEIEILRVLIYNFESRRRNVLRGSSLVRELIRKLDWSQAELARRIGVDKGSVSSMLNDRRPITLDRAKRFAALFSMPLDRFIHNEYIGDIDPVFS